MTLKGPFLLISTGGVSALSETPNALFPKSSVEFPLWNPWVESKWNNSFWLYSLLFLMCVSDSNKHSHAYTCAHSCCVSTALVAPLFVSQRRVNKFRRQPEQTKAIFEETWSGTNTCNGDVGGVFSPFFASRSFIPLSRPVYADCAVWQAVCLTMW